MAGQYLRTNYRATGGKLDATLGNAINLASAAGGAGTTDPCGGILFFSMALSFAEASAGIAAGFSQVFGDSTYGTLSLYYGSGNFGSGYLFYPIKAVTMSYSTVAAADWVTNDSAPNFIPFNYATSGSVWRISAMKISATGSGTYACSVAARLLILGFIVSAP